MLALLSLLASVLPSRARRSGSVLEASSTPLRLPNLTNHPRELDVIESLVLVDTRRGKALDLRITYPETGGPYPVIVFSHGAWGSKDDYQLLVQHWSRAGYVCIQLNHSDAGSLGGEPGPGAFRDWANRPRDISRVLDTLDDLEHELPALRGKLDHAHVGIGGHSFGAGTAQLLGGVTVKRRTGAMSFRDPRVLAILLLSPPGRNKLHERESWSQFALPMMTITGTRDRGRSGEDYRWRLEPFEFSPPGDKYLVVIKGADHDMGGITRSSARYPYAREEDLAHIVQDASTRFWDAYLKNDPDAKRFLLSRQLLDDLAHPATLQVK